MNYNRKKRIKYDAVKSIIFFLLAVIITIVSCQPTHNTETGQPITDSLFDASMEHLIAMHEFPIEKKGYFNDTIRLSEKFSKIKSIQNHVLNYNLELREYCPDGNFYLKVVHAHNDSTSVIIPFIDDYWHRMNACKVSSLSDNLLMEQYLIEAICKFKYKPKEYNTEFMKLPSFEYAFITDFMLLMDEYDRLNLSDSVKLAYRLNYNYAFRETDSCALIQERSKLQILEYWKTAIDSNNVIFYDIDPQNLYYINKGTPLVYHFSFGNNSVCEELRVNTYNEDCTCYFVW